MALMTINDIMEFIESEYNIINSTPCEICGGSFIAEKKLLALIDDVPFDVCNCTCEDCGHKRSFSFTAPFIPSLDNEELKNRLN